MDLSYFFYNEKQIIEEGLDIGFRLYGPAHLIWLACITAGAILLSGWYKRQDAAKRSKIRVFFALALASSEVIRDTVLCVTEFFRLEHLPFHLCGLAIFALLADAFWPRQKVTGNMIAYAFMPGATAALLFCNWTAYPIASFMNIHSFVFHGWILCYFLMRYRAGEIRPTYRGLWLTTCSLVLLIYPLFKFNQFADSNFMFLNEASEGSPLVPLWNIFGVRWGHVGYILSVIALAVTVFHVLYLLYRTLDSRKKQISHT